MTKSKTSTAHTWVSNLRSFMEQQNLNPRSLSLKAGLNATAVRDMIEGRSRFPRYDTVEALAKALETTPAILMSNEAQKTEISAQGGEFHGRLDLLTEIIARLQETTEELGIKLEPRDFAAMTATIYQRLQMGKDGKSSPKIIGTQIHDLLDYELMRKKRAR